MEKDREKKLREIVGERILEIKTEGPKSNAVLIIINNNEDDRIQRKLKDDGFVFFSPRELSQAAIKNIQTWDESTKKGYKAVQLKPTLMIVDPTQEEKSQFLAQKIIGFYTSKAINYNIFNKTKADIIPAFEGIGELEGILTNVGFTVHKSDDGNKIIVIGSGFSLTVDGTSGEIIKITTQEETKINTGSSRKDMPKNPISVDVFGKFYELGKKGINKFGKLFSNSKGNLR